MIIRERMKKYRHFSLAIYSRINSLRAVFLSELELEGCCSSVSERGHLLWKWNVKITTAVHVVGSSAAK